MKKPPGWQYDGMVTQDAAAGRQMRVFVPCWWEWRRWLQWWLLPKTVTKGKLTLSTDDGTVTVRCHGI